MLFKPTFWLKNVFSIDEEFLKKNGVKALVLDMDNTLSMHGDPKAEDGVMEWLDKMRGLGVKMRVVSNNTTKRVKRRKAAYVRIEPRDKGNGRKKKRSARHRRPDIYGRSGGKFCENTHGFGRAVPP